MRLLPNRLPRHEHGATLVIALIFLVLLTLLGVTVASNNTLQERMAGNTRQRDLAFQAAEYALKAADAAVNDLTSAEYLYINDVITSHPSPPTTATQPNQLHKEGDTVIGITDPYTIGHTNDSLYWNSTFPWTNNTSIEITGISSALAASNPRYTVEQLPPATCPEDASKTCFYYRATAHGIGKDSNAVVILQSMYKFKP